LRSDLRRSADFSRVHPLPRSGTDVPDDLDARLVVLPAEFSYTKEPGSAAENAAKAILESRGNTPRLYQNTLVFLAADKVRLQDLDEAVRRFLAWQSILDEKETLNLDPHQVRQAETQRQAADGAVVARLPETYQWLLVPEQANPQAPVSWQATRLTAGEGLAARASKRLRSDELLVPSLGPTILRKHLDEVPLWRGEHVSVKQLAEDFARYLYLPRLKGPEVLVGAIQDGLGLLRRYRGLQCAQRTTIGGADDPGILVKPDAARAQLDAETTTIPPDSGNGSEPTGPVVDPGPEPPPAPVATKATRYHGSISLDATRVGRDAGRVADEVISHLSGLMGSKVEVTLEIKAQVPDGVPDNVVRIVTENGRTLKFATQGFEKE
jgi:hypothetical protein